MRPICEICAICGSKIRLGGSLALQQKNQSSMIAPDLARSISASVIFRTVKS
jgi:hypothetical protein